MKLTKLKSSSESRSEQKEDSNDGCSFAEGNCSTTAVTGVAGEPALTRANLCSSSSADNVGRGGNWKAGTAAADKSGALAVKSPGLMNLTLGWASTADCAVGELGDEEKEEDELQIEADRRSEAWLADPGRSKSGTTGAHQVSFSS